MTDESETSDGNKQASKRRLFSIDALRGLVIVLMALDHSRDFFGDMRIPVEDPQTTTWAFFFTRWCTHFCAPTFVLLAGVSAGLYGMKLPTKSELSGFLLKRGLWLLCLEFTVVYFSLALSIDILPWMFLVIATIGSSMVLLSAACWLPTHVVLGLGLVIALGHNLLDGIGADVFGTWGWLWMIIHDGPGYIPEMNLEVAYPILPWFGVMCIGYGISPVFTWTRSQRAPVLLIAGACILLAFFVVRGANGYGNSRPWSWVPENPPVEIETDGQGEALLETSASTSNAPASNKRTLFSFLATGKYPPSVAYLLMTLGPALIVLTAFEFIRDSSWLIRGLCVFGRVPLFFYVIHFYVLHLGSILTYWVVRGQPLSPFQTMYESFGGEAPEIFGFQTLWQVYVAWFLVLILLFPMCKLYHRYCKSTGHRIWSYL